MQINHPDPTINAKLTQLTAIRSQIRELRDQEKQLEDEVFGLVVTNLLAAMDRTDASLADLKATIQPNSQNS